MLIPTWKKYGVAVALLLGFLFLFSMYLLTVNRTGSFDNLSVTRMALAVCGMGLCVMLLLTLLMDVRINLGGIYFITMLLINFFALFFSNLYAIYLGNEQYTWLIQIAEYLNPAFLISIMLTFWLYLGFITGLRERLYLELEAVFFALFFLGLVMLIINIPTGYIFYVTKEATVVYGSMGKIIYVPLLCMLLVGMVGVQALVKGVRKKVALAMFLLAPLLSIILDFILNPVGTINIIFCLSLLIIYGNFYVGRSKELILKDAELMEQRAKILISQIQPHFLYNSLTSIMNIKGNPPATREAISDFGMYLRGNLDSLKKSGPIAFAAELDHVETYIMLEKLGMGEKLNYETDLKVRNFFIPAQTIQMLVEYCIDFGLRPSGGGTVLVRSSVAGGSYQIQVTHDGTAFTRATLAEDESKHPEGVTFSSLNDRLADTLGGSIELLRRDGPGNTFLVTLPIPKKSRAARGE